MDWACHFDRVFEHLGYSAKYRAKGESKFHEITVLCRSPENFYELGANEIVGQVAELVFRKIGIPSPHIGDTIVVSGKTYKFHEEPLLDASNLLWKANAVLVK